MRVLMINVVCGIGSTGRICTDLAHSLMNNGHECMVAYGRDDVPESHKAISHRIGNNISIYKDVIFTRLLDNAGFNSRKATQNLIRWIKEYNPDIIHLHNLHGYYINVEILFNYLKKSRKPIIWTLHDCWAFTGHCVFFDFFQCNKWLTGCSSCPQKSMYPQSLFWDNSEENYKKKKDIFTNVPNLTIVTPSKWLREKVNISFLRDYKVEVINNGVNIRDFKPIDSELRNNYGIYGDKLILAVANSWTPRKGLDTVLELSRRFGKGYRFVIIGLNSRDALELPENVIGIEHTNSVKELAQWYSTADLYINPTHEDNYPTTNLEAIACGTPVISYNTGGSGESAKLYGKAIIDEDVDLLETEIRDFLNRRHPNVSQETLKYVSMKRMEDEYSKLYSNTIMSHTVG